ncbi:DUF3427 domain-containing protein [Alicyclobacillus sp.]|uniref:DUF3427 domain-containing protein n=1 Tax=Alicyclobacillus sp. TaxID=61169 RepID=UPI0025BBFA09|nr:DEAD/DEAH box helicase [Alicyclobacillus sp.]MCL6515315.1 DUF3427 domain-containing protein [Alicyclobacillus sp.]
MKSGLYEQLVNEMLHRELADARPEQVIKEALDAEESTQVLADYVAHVLRWGLARIGGETALAKRMDVCNRLIAWLARQVDDETMLDWAIRPEAEMLLALLDERNCLTGAGIRGKDVIRPLTSLAHGTLFTGAVHEPNLVGELKKEILTADRVDMLVSFVKWSGLRLVMDELRQLTLRGTLRVITTSYMGATDARAVEELSGLPNTEVRISYDTRRTRLHAKAYIFHRDTGFSTAYVGSSNLSSAALTTGLEWNVKVTAREQPDIFEKVSGTFETYWHDPEFVPYSDAQRPVLIRALKAERGRQEEGPDAFLFDIHPYAYQREILEKLQAEREVGGRYRNLVVAATGTGKTVISAFDYRRFREAHPNRPNRLMFVAHREEILRQSLACFRTVLRDPNFGDLFVGGSEPRQMDHLFVSIQTYNARNFPQFTDPDFYDFVIVDEFHHAAAPSYRRLLEHVRPKVLLGLTATPERHDNRDILSYFDNRIAAEIRLPEAIERGLLVPFHYFGVSDDVDLSRLRWSRGGYDTAELDRLYTGNRRRAQLILQSVKRYVTDLSSVVGLGFCVSVDHARFMADFFSRNGVPSMAVHADTPSETRRDVQRQLIEGALRFVFVVDLYNEGVDIPEVNTILFLRPTESLTVFLQQLGRGLRLCEGKACLTVLDFIGQAHRSYRFQEKFAGLLAGSTRDFERQIREGFPDVPRGSFIQLERQAMEWVLANVRSAQRHRSAWVRSIQSFEEETGKPLTLANFLHHVGLSPRAFYRHRNSFARLCAEAGRRDAFVEPDEAVLTKALVRLAGIDSRRWIDFLIRCLCEEGWTDEALSEEEGAMLRMFHYTVWQKPLEHHGFRSLADSVARVRRNPVLAREMVELLRHRRDGIDFVDEPVHLGFPCPLDLHCSYTRDQALAGLGFYTEARMPAMREGVVHLPDRNLDVLFITLNKADKDFSPSTMYQDYAISDVLFHWQSQNATSPDSQTGRRYIHHREQGGRVVLFVREFKHDAAGSLPYTYLGTAEYVRHSGSRPMNIVWRLHRPLPAKLWRETNKWVVG